MTLTEYKPFCQTTRQLEILTAYVDNGQNKAATAKALGVDESTVRSILKTIERNKQEPLPLKGTSTLYKTDPETNETTQVLQWVKTNRSNEELQALSKQVLEGFLEEMPKTKPVKRPAKTTSDLVNLYTLTDFHLGALAWGEETLGEDWDLSIAEELLYKWIDTATDRAPDAQTAVLLQLGDLLHWDSMLPVTPASGHVLDADTRFAKVVRVAIKSMRYIIEALLKKHDDVHIVMADANHDPTTGVWLREWLSVHYENDKRVQVDTSPSTYGCLRMDKLFLSWHHGHKRNISKHLDKTIVGNFKEEYGQASWAYCHTGHYHSTAKTESELMIIEQHPTLAASDAYSSWMGYVSNRTADVITYHTRYGEQSRIRISAQELQQR